MNKFQEILPFLKTIEKQRQKIAINYVFIGIGAFVGVCFIISNLGLVAQSKFIATILGLVIIVFATKKHYLKNMEKKIKAKVLNKIIQNLGFSWTNSFINSNIITKSKLFVGFDFMSKDDEFVALKDNLAIAICEAKISKNAKIKRSNLMSKIDTPSAFNGVIIACMFYDKNISSHTILVPKNSAQDVLNLNKTELESPKFNEKYAVFTNDEIEARVILNPSFMEKLSEFTNIFGKDEAYCAFYENIVLVGINSTKDLFALQIKQNLEEYKEQFDKITSELKSVINLIDYLNLKKIYK